MITVSVVSLKGGVGKTSVVLGLAGAAQAAGLRALVVDLDPQANTSMILGSDQADFTMNDVLADGGPGVMADAIQESGWGPGVDVVPSE
ncbi:MAG: chromosome partitioning protein, partial [Frankiaceae bacterium]|nr:chromosome partitioning protein [Frankiaceae bacterium]